MNSDHFEKLLNVKAYELTVKSKTKTGPTYRILLRIPRNKLAVKNLAEIRAHIWYNAVLVGILILYGLLGACVFRKLEAVNSASLPNDHKLEDSKEKLLKELWNQDRLEFDQWSTQARNKLDSYENNFKLQLSNTAEWSLVDSWLFACTIFTTIGKKDIFKFIQGNPRFILDKLPCLTFSVVNLIRHFNCELRLNFVYFL